MAKHHELTTVQKGKWKRQGIAKFLAGKYKPGLSGYQPATKASKEGDAVSGRSVRNRPSATKGKDEG
ncbi:MAG: hypothetical protein Q8P12_04410, partial [bacterium]|nr:hypothetical protein [bacterium]